MIRIRCLTVVTAALFVVSAAFAPEEALEERPLRLALELSGGSRIIGVPSLSTVAVETPFGKLDIPVKQIKSIRFEKDHETVSVELRNGDKFSGIVGLRELKLVTTFLGEVSIKIQHVRSIEVRQSSLLPTQLFRVTQGKYGDIENVEEIVESEVGADYRLADWQDLLAHKEEITEFIQEIGMLEGADNSFKVSNEGKRLWGDTLRHYFVSRLNHNKPSYYLAHDHIDNYLIALGSWPDKKFPFLCIHKEASSLHGPDNER